MASLGREHQRLVQVVEKAATLHKYDDELAEVRELVGVDDPEMAAEAQAELTRLTAATAAPRSAAQAAPPARTIRSTTATASSKSAPVPAATGARSSPANSSACTRYIERKGWKIELLSLADATLGGVKEAIFTVEGAGAFGEMRGESGVHRVQRVPATEAQGRIHTSAATVAVLPEAEEIDLKIEDKDLRIDVFRSSGPGGQSVNTTDSAVRITHIPSGLVVSQQDQKSQLQNKLKGMQVLRARLLDMKVAAQEAEPVAPAQVAGEHRRPLRKTVARTTPQNRVTDHRINYTSHDLPAVLNGDLAALIEAFKLATVEEQLGGGN